jgi:hypothetical protein
MNNNDNNNIHEIINNNQNQNKQSRPHSTSSSRCRTPLARAGYITSIPGKHPINFVDIVDVHATALTRAKMLQDKSDVDLFEKIINDAYENRTVVLQDEFGDTTATWFPPFSSNDYYNGDNDEVQINEISKSKIEKQRIIKESAHKLKIKARIEKAMKIACENDEKDEQEDLIKDEMNDEEERQNNVHFASRRKDGKANNTKEVHKSTEVEYSQSYLNLVDLLSEKISELTLQDQTITNEADAVECLTLKNSRLTLEKFTSVAERYLNLNQMKKLRKMDFTSSYIGLEGNSI